MAARRKRRVYHKHTFILHVDAHDGRGTQEVPLICRVVPAKRGVKLILKTEDVDLSNKLGGVGNSMLCAMAQCTKRLKVEFPHPHLGVIDWLLKTCFVLTKMPTNKALGECVKYEHTDNIAHEFDEVGQKKLLARLEKNGGQVFVHLHKARNRHGERKGGTGRITGERSKVSGLGGAAKRRFANALAQRIELAPTKTGYQPPEGRPRSSPPNVE